MNTIQKISPFLWFDDQAEEAVRFYAGIFPDSSIDTLSRYEHGGVMAIGFTLAGSGLVALNGGPQYTFTEAVSLMVYCDTQAEIDHYWSRLTTGGSERPCGWLEDRYGLFWQIVPKQMLAMISDADPAKANRVMQAVMQMRKLDLATLEAASRG